MSDFANFRKASKCVCVCVWGGGGHFQSKSFLFRNYLCRMGVYHDFLGNSVEKGGRGPDQSKKYDIILLTKLIL